MSFNLDDIGEIFVSTDTAFRNSKVFGTEFCEEITLYLIHGILHILGYRDESVKEKAGMSRKESEILKCLCGREDLSKVLTRR